MGRGLILGPGDSGKTTLAARLAQDWVPPEHRNTRLFCVGPVDKLARLAGVDNHNVDWTSREKQDEFFRTINETEGPLVVVVDEADLYYTGGGRHYGSKEFQYLINVGRNFGHGVILIARGDSDLATNTRGQMTSIFMFRTHERRLLEHADEWFRDVPDATDYITTLGDHEFMLWCPRLNPPWQGTGKLANGQIYIVPPGSPDPSEPTETPEEGTPGSDEPAPTPDAGESFPTSAPPTSAPSTTPSGSGNNLD